MRFRTKLLFAFLLVAIGSALVGLLIMYENSNRLLFNQVRSKAASIATTAAAQINLSLVKQLNGQPQDEKTPAYQDLQSELRKLRNANRRFDIYIRYVYLIRPVPDKPQDWMYLIDAEENPKLISHPGEVMPPSDVTELDQNPEAPFAERTYLRDPWGNWLTAYAPIFDKDGHYLATLGIDLSASDIEIEMNRLVLAGLLALFVSVVIALSVGFWFARIASKPLATLCDVVKDIGEGKLDTEAEVTSNDEFSQLAKAINEMAHGLRERERLKTNFARYVSVQVLDKILQGETAMKVEGERRKITVLFSDIRQFTQLAESLPPEQVVALLNQYFDRMIDVIFAHFGTLDKFIGDGIMVEFGTPLDDPLQEEHAVNAAFGMIEELKKLNEHWKTQSKSPIQIGIGIHTGLAIVGNIGSEKRLEFTAIGDTVNVAARLEQLTKQLHQQILISETTYMALQRKYVCRNLGLIQLPGRTEPIHVYVPEKIATRLEETFNEPV
jgi:adenylate cyclase